MRRRTPSHLAENSEGGQDPPRVADVRLLLRPPVQPPRVALPLAEPPAKQPCSRGATKKHKQTKEKSDRRWCGTGELWSRWAFLWARGGRRSRGGGGKTAMAAEPKDAPTTKTHASCIHGGTTTQRRHTSIHPLFHTRCVATGVRASTAKGTAANRQRAPLAAWAKERLFSKPPPLTPSFPPGSLSRSDARKLDAKQVRQRSLSLQDRGGEQDAHTFVHEVKRPCDRQRAHTREDLSRVGLRPWDAAEAAVEVATPGGGAYGVREDVKRKDGEGEGRGGKGTTVHACLDLSACQHKCRGGRGRCRCRCRL